MTFNSLQFFFFFIFFYGVYRLLPHKRRNIWLLAASYFFYGCWDWRFLGLIWLSTLVDYLCALQIHRSVEKKRRTFWLSVSIVSNLSILGFFKYAGFFLDSLKQLLLLLGWGHDIPLLRLILPVGISFYTFQTLGYTIDVYRNKIDPVKDLLDYSLYVAYFPQLVAGPIERAHNLVPQFSRNRVITSNQIREGLWLINFGLFKKIFIADNLAFIVDAVFQGHTAISGGEVLMAIYAFSFQIYGDFSGYSDIARGTSKLMGIEIMENFKFPYFVTTPRDFWRNWHISLSTWLKDYLYIPLGGNRCPQNIVYRNLFITMLLGGLWHGAAWKFVFWGAYHGGVMIAFKHFDSLGKRMKRSALDRCPHLFKVIIMFHITCLGWLFFRSESLSQAFSMIKTILFDFWTAPETTTYYALKIVIFVLPLLILQLIHKMKDNLFVFAYWPTLARWLVMFFMFYLTLCFGEFGERAFIYFQF